MRGSSGGGTKPQGCGLGRGVKTCIPIFTVSCGITLAGMLWGAPGWAQVRQLYLPTETASKSIPELARQADIQIIGPGEPLQYVITPAVKGSFDVVVALEMMLKGTDFKVSRIMEGVIAISLSKKTSVCDDEGETMKYQHSLKTGVSWMALAFATIPCALAQSVDNAQTMETIVVSAPRTGTNIAGIAPVGTESLVLNHDQMLATGLTSVADITRTIPQVQTIDALGREGGTSAANGNVTQGNAINLRGLGTRATLTLVDGRRVAPTGTGDTFTDANIVPLAVLDRVEVLIDGASAVYGSDAVGGVINYIVRKDYTGAQAAVRYNYNHGYSEWGVSATIGQAWSHLGAFGAGNFILSYDFDGRTSMMTGSQPFLRRDLRQFGGNDNRVIGSYISPAADSAIFYTHNATTDEYRYYNVLHTTGSQVPSLTPADPNKDPSLVYVASSLDKNLTHNSDLNLVDASDYQTFLGRMWRHQVTAFVNQEVTPWLSVFAEGFFTKRQTTSYGLDQTNPLSLNTAGTDSPSPWNIADFNGTGLTQGVSFNFGQAETVNPEETYTATVGFVAKLPFDWTANGYYTNGLDHVCGMCHYNDNIDQDAMNHFIGDGEINPFAIGSMTPTQRALITGRNVQFGRNMINDYVLKFDGPLFELPGGTVRAAIGGEYSYNTEHLTNGANRSHGFEADIDPVRNGWNDFAYDTINGRSRVIESGFAELFVPVVGEKNHVPLVKEFSIDAAVRYDQYSDEGSTTNPKVGATWAVDDSYTVRGSWGTSFHAPTLTDLNEYVQSWQMVFPGGWGVFPNRSGDPSLDGPDQNCPWLAPTYCVSSVVHNGNNSKLRPETSENWSLGIDFKSRWLEGFEASTTYYNVAYKNKIVNMSDYMWQNYIGSPASRALYKDYIHPVHNPANCNGNDASTWDPVLKYWVKTVVSVYGNIDRTQICSVSMVFDGANSNFAGEVQRGLDINLTYLLPTDHNGLFNFGLYATTVLDNKNQIVGSAPVEQIGGINQPIRWRGRGSIGWSLDKLAASVFVNYTGPGVNSNPTFSYVPKGAPAYYTTDVTVAYAFTDQLGWSGFSGTRLTFSAQNVFDQNPPIELNGTTSAYDGSHYGALGRTVTLQLTKDF